MELYVVRHGSAFDADPTKWPDDRQRPLTPEGKKRLRDSAKGLKRLINGVDVMLSSPWPRAWATAEILEREAGWPTPLPTEALESGRAPAEVLQALRPHAAAAAVALVGHEPSLHELVSYLLTAETSHVQVVFKKGGVVCLELDATLRPGSARLLWALQPKMLRQLA